MTLNIEIFGDREKMLSFLNKNEKKCIEFVKIYKKDEPEHFLTIPHVYKKSENKVLMFHKEDDNTCLRQAFFMHKSFGIQSLFLIYKKEKHAILRNMAENYYYILCGPLVWDNSDCISEDDLKFKDPIKIIDEVF